MITHGMAQQTGKQMGMTAAPPYAPLALDSDSDALAECLAANFILPLDRPPIVFDFFSKVRDCLTDGKLNIKYRIEAQGKTRCLTLGTYQNRHVSFRKHFVIGRVVDRWPASPFGRRSFRCFFLYQRLRLAVHRFLRLGRKLHSRRRRKHNCLRITARSRRQRLKYDDVIDNREQKRTRLKINQ